MKKSFIPLLLFIAILGCTLFPTDDRIAGVYTYTGIFFSQQLYNDTSNIGLGDTIITAGAITLNWQTVNTIVGTKIVVEKSIGDTDNYGDADSVPVNQVASYVDSVLSGATYYYKVSLVNDDKKTLMNVFTIDIPQLIIRSPQISDLTAQADSFDIVFSSIDNNSKYSIKITNLNGDSIWGIKDLTDTVTTCEGKISQAGLYSATVTTIVQDLLESQSIVTTTGMSQFYLQ